MTNIQFTNQENQANFVGQGVDQPAPATSSVPTDENAATSKGLRFVPPAIFLAFIFVGGLIIYKMQTSSQPVAEDPAISDTGLSQDLLEQITIQTPEASRPSQIAATPAPTPVTTATRPNRPRAVITGNTAAPVSTAVSKGGQVSAAAPQVVTTATTSNTDRIQTITTQTTDNVTITVKKEAADDSYKPGTPVMRDCGGWSDDRWHPNVTLPRFTKDDKKAVEYWVQIGTGHNESNVKDEKYQTGEEVNLSFTAENDKDYYAKFAIRMENGDWQKWSNSLRLKCRKDW